MALTFTSDVVEKIVVVMYNKITKKYQKVIMTGVEDMTIDPAEPVVVEDGMLKISGHKGTETTFRGVAEECETIVITKEEAKAIGA